MPETLEEGWYTDPYGRHEARWISDGKPTKLVRDGTVESHDEPPDEPPSSAPRPIGLGAQIPDAEDFRRADDGRDYNGDPPRLYHMLWQPDRPK
jgi:hypothetical protein